MRSRLRRGYLTFLRNVFMPIVNERKRIPTYFSHSYRAGDRDINLFFWKLFWAAGFLVTVDPKSDVLSIPYLEFTMRHSACFASVIPCRPDQKPETLFSLCTLGIRSSNPGTETASQYSLRTVSSQYFPQGSEGLCIFKRDRLNYQEEEFIRAIDSLREKSQGYGPTD